MKFRLGILFLLVFGLSSTVYGLSDIAAKEAIYGDLFLESPSLQYTPPTWFQPHSLSSAPTDATYWINTVLPYEEDRYEDIYLVIPQLGLVTPVVQIPKGSSDYQTMKNGNQIDINKYLVAGIIEYASSVAPGNRGKRIDFGHSNFFKDQPGRYKSIFANLMALDPGDQAWYYVKNSAGGYDLFRYEVQESFNTDPTIGVKYMQYDGDGADALIFGCTHGLDGRWMIQATYMGEPTGKPVAYVDPFKDLDSTLKWRVSKAVQKIGRLKINAKKYEIVQLIKMIGNVREKLGDRITDSQKLLLDYIEHELVSIFPG